MATSDIADCAKVNLPRSVLVAEDEPGCLHLLRQQLEQFGYEVTVCTDGIAACQLLQNENAPNMAILDWMMPGMDGLQVCQAVRARPSARYTYLVLLTAKNRKKDLIKGFQAGADDFLTKPVDEDELQVRLQAGQRVLAWQEQLIKLREELRVKATRDALTGLWNRGTISELFEIERKRARREKKPIGVAIVDLDHFKKINDTYGHLAGDAVLRSVGGILSEVLRPYDLVGRYGGEEFLIVLPGCDQDNARNLCDRLARNLEACVTKYEGHAIPVTASIGLAVAAPDDTIDADAADLLKIADRALYHAKASGRNRIVLGTDGVGTP